MLLCVGSVFLRHDFETLWNQNSGLKSYDTLNCHENNFQKNETPVFQFKNSSFSWKFKRLVENQHPKIEITNENVHPVGRRGRGMGMGVKPKPPASARRGVCLLFIFECQNFMILLRYDSSSKKVNLKLSHVCSLFHPLDIKNT